MKVVLTYIHHNCFVMKTDTRTFLFDCPGDAHLPVNGADSIGRAVADTELTVFISHGHEDHLNEDLDSLTSPAKSVQYVLSEDIEDMRPEALPTKGEVLIVEPDETYAYDGMRIETLMSNDLGVAFLVTDGAFRFYFGGDLAKWIWKTASAREQAFTSAFFRQAMQRVSDFKPHVAFSNVDQRLENLAGGVEAYHEAGARVFVPMHTFGETDWLPRFAASLGASGDEVFLYANTGDRVEYVF
ncbi:MBL fold metallo-hydrolase [Pseudodesulfovibrio sediminis]|uniref:Metallo-beta-lactamase domain-containing protein n=1 Tax=Pseudodesulfovibrio sediminis TaxID=2810563 RepID=A0ABN6EUK1_9BACT|nr:MBL fold metallo-hydrolase [Pseudodesulfovibrio sediminis]BCS89997.1 hypothetical protein PSDVSF_32390 [Pseudodesulfovibrio sediminis]